MKTNTAGNIFLIKDRETLKLIADPLRGQILETLTSEPQTVKQVANRLGLAPGKLYYHISLLEKHGFLQVVETRQVANMLEKTYQAVASKLDIAPALLTTTTDEGKDVVYELVTSTLDTTREDLLRSLQARYQQLDQGAPQKPRNVVINREVCCIPEARAVEFEEKIKSLLKEFAEAEVPAGTPGAMNYGLALAFYPSFYYEEIKENE